MKILLTIFAALMFTTSSFAGDVLKVKSKDYTCSDLQDLVQEEGTVHIKHWGSLDVHASPNACFGTQFGHRLEAYTASWKTIDKRFCIAGYSCRIDNDDRSN